MRNGPLLFSSDIREMALFDTTSRALGVQMNRGWRRAWASHPSEDLSEPSPLRDPCGANETPQALWLDGSTIVGG